MPRSRILIAVVSAGVALALQPQPATAFWRAPGSGTGSGSTTTMRALVVAPGTPTQSLFPTGLARGDVATTLTNPNAFPVSIPRLALDTTRGSGGYAVDAAHAACTVASLSYTTQTNGGAGWTVPGAGAISVDLTNAIALSTGAPNACQAATFTVYLTS